MVHGSVGSKHVYEKARLNTREANFDALHQSNYNSKFPTFSTAPLPIVGCLRSTESLYIRMDRTLGTLTNNNNALPQTVHTTRTLRYR